MKKTFTYILFAFFVVFLFVPACEVDEIPEPPPGKSNKISFTSSLLDTSYRTAKVALIYMERGNVLIKQHGHCWNTTENPDLNSDKTELGTNLNDSISDISNLLPDSQYYLRAYIKLINDIILYSDQIAFNTTTSILPVFSSIDLDEIELDKVTIISNISDNGGYDITSRGVCWNTSTGPTISNNFTNDGSEIGSITSSLEQFEESKKYYVRAYATTAVGTSYSEEISFTTWLSMSDIDGNTYKAIQIYDQIWMAENLKSTHYADGTAIIEGVGSATSLDDYITKYYYWYDNDNNYAATYGALYNWAAAMNGQESSNEPGAVQGVCPDGWHLPSAEEWGILIDSLGGTDVAGDKLKEDGFEHWEETNTGTNESRFTALPSGDLYDSYGFTNLGRRTNFWTTWETSYDTSVVFTRNLYSSSSSASIGYHKKTHAHPVRCIRDIPGGNTPIVNTSDITEITPASALCGGNVTDDGGSVITEKGVCWSIITNPTISDNSTSDGTGSGEFVSTITGLSSNTKYYVRAYATNIIGTSYGDQKEFTTLDYSDACGGITTILDFDGNVYNTVSLGYQCWMKENLTSLNYSDGTAISGVSVYDNDENNVGTYGRLYNWAAVMNGAASSNTNPSGVQGVCPIGWHVPSSYEWSELEVFLGINSEEAYDYGDRGTDEGGKLKETGTSHWNAPNLGATNEIDFTVLPGGRWWSNSFDKIGEMAYFWTTKEVDYRSDFRSLGYDNAQVAHFAMDKTVKASVRCVKD